MALVFTCAARGCRLVFRADVLSLGGPRFQFTEKREIVKTASVHVVTDSLPRQQCKSDPSKGASAEHGGPHGCLLFSVQQKGQPAK